MKKILILIIVLFSYLAHAQVPEVRYQMFKKYTQAQIDAIDVSDTSVTYFVENTDLGNFQVNRGAGWVNLFGSIDLSGLPTLAGVNTFTGINRFDQAITIGFGNPSGSSELGLGYISSFLGNKLFQVHMGDYLLNMRGSNNVVHKLNLPNLASPKVWDFPDDSGKFLTEEKAATLYGGSGLNNIVEDTSPELGGNLEVGNYAIIPSNFSAEIKYNGVTDIWDFEGANGISVHQLRVGDISTPTSPYSYISPVLLTSNREHKLPDKPGTFAMLDDIVGGGTTNLSTIYQSNLVTLNNDNGTNADINLATGTNAGVSENNFTAAEKSKLAAIEDIGHTIQENGTNQTTRANLNFKGAVTLDDNAGNNSTDVTFQVTGGFSGNTGYEELVATGGETTWVLSETPTPSANNQLYIGGSADTAYTLLGASQYSLSGNTLTLSSAAIPSAGEILKYYYAKGTTAIVVGTSVNTAVPSQVIDLNNQGGAVFYTPEWNTTYTTANLIARGWSKISIDTTGQTVFPTITGATLRAGAAFAADETFDMIVGTDDGTNAYYYFLAR